MLACLLLARATLSLSLARLVPRLHHPHSKPRQSARHAARSPLPFASSLHHHPPIPQHNRITARELRNVITRYTSGALSSAASVDASAPCHMRQRQHGEFVWRVARDALPAGTCTGSRRRPRQGSPPHPTHQWRLEALCPCPACCFYHAFALSHRTPSPRPLRSLVPSSHAASVHLLPVFHCSLLHSNVSIAERDDIAVHLHHVLVLEQPPSLLPCLPRLPILRPPALHAQPFHCPPYPSKPPPPSCSFQAQRAQTLGCGTGGEHGLTSLRQRRELGPQQLLASVQQLPSLLLVPVLGCVQVVCSAHD